ncbi:hypothetical protein M153_11486000412 [Pseudoloma neurophilia]|uniref:Uncharacterized protein n=1 Tax=Pseudoloma neurophilia TaxID=146866 RepID=A0A0R0LYI8_9MICR|nr:hypothetical protein M153_11486000412 [Pseudoloma neurophilia]
MIILPPVNTLERAEYDLKDLKKLFMRCQKLGISKDIEIRKNVCELKESAGKEGFCIMFVKFYNLVETKSKKIYGIDDCNSEMANFENEFFSN